MCSKQEETFENLFNTYPTTDQMWKNINSLFHQSDRNNQSLRQTIENWRKGGYQSPVVNKAWTLDVGFLFWSLWKERNRRIFQNVKMKQPEIWQLSLKDIRETILAKKWAHEDWIVQGMEAH